MVNRASVGDGLWRGQPEPSGDVRCLPPPLPQLVLVLVPHLYGTYSAEALGTSRKVNHPDQHLLATGHSSGCLCMEGF